MEGFSLWGGGWNCPLGDKEIKELGHFHTPFFLFFIFINACMHLWRGRDGLEGNFVYPFVYLKILHIFIVTIKNPRKLKMQLI